MALRDRMRNIVNLFKKKEPLTTPAYTAGSVSMRRPDKRRSNYGNERSILAAVLTRIATDSAQIKMQVVKCNENDQMEEIVEDSGLNDCLNIRANKDQAASAFRQDVVQSLVDEGVIALVPVDWDTEPENKTVHDFDILSLRVARITGWHPDHIRVDIYDDTSGLHKQEIIPKNMAAIVENPFYNVMNEQSSTLRRIVRKLNLLDYVDEQTSSGKLDIIIQLPYVIKSEARKAQAEQRRSDIEEQLAGSKYGIAYTDGTEHITQLNRPAENNLLAQVESLMELFHSQVGITKEIMEGTASEDIMNNYYERTITPIITAITEELTTKFVKYDAIKQYYKVKAFNPPFKFVPTSKLPDLADKLIRNQILTSNEFRGVIGYKPSEQPVADELRNPNLNRADNEIGPVKETKEKEENQNE